MHKESYLDKNQRLLIISNRLPIVVENREDSFKVIPGSGGLITALNPLLKQYGGTWIGWHGTSELSSSQLEIIKNQHFENLGYSLSPINLTESEIDLFYEGFSNKIIWPLFHDLQSQCHFDPSYWGAYKEVTAKFAEHVIQQAKPDDFIWIHDYHLMLLGQELRNRGVNSKLVFFLHIPFTPLDIFLKIPWRFEILQGMLNYDFIGFQTVRDYRNFIQCITALLTGVEIEVQETHAICRQGEHEVYLGVFPISIDFEEFDSTAKSEDVKDAAKHIKETLNDRKIIFSVDRLDYTKGIPYRLEGIHWFLEHYPEMHEKVTFIQLVIPSRAEIPEYHSLHENIERIIGQINGKYTTSGWVPVHYMYYSLDREHLGAYYSAADAILVTSIKDGMNLVAKEYIASNIDKDGVVILSEFAGAACELQDYALLINPYDIEGVAKAINTALLMPEEERKKRMKALRNVVKENDIFHWISRIFDAVRGNQKKIGPLSREYVPTENNEFS